MIGSTHRVRVFAYAQPCDMRKHYDSLAVIVAAQMGHELLSGDLFLFVGQLELSPPRYSPSERLREWR